MACLLPSRADPRMSHSYAGNSRKPTPTPSALDFGSEEASSHRPNLCNSFTVPSHPLLPLLNVSPPMTLRFDMLNEAIWPSPVTPTGIGSWGLSSDWNRGSNNPLSWWSQRDVIGLFCVGQSSRPSPRGGSEVYQSRPAGYTKTCCVPHASMHYFAAFCGPKRRV